MPYDPMVTRTGLPFWAEDVELEGVRAYLRTELEDVTDLDGRGSMRSPRTALRAGVTRLHDDDVEVLVDLEVTAGDDVSLACHARLVGARVIQAGALGDPRVGDVAERLPGQSLRADVAAATRSGRSVKSLGG